MASTSAVRCTGTALRAAVIRVAVTGGLTLLACVFGSAVASAATSSDAPQANAIANTLQTDMSDLVNSLLVGLGGQHHIGLPGGVSVSQPPAGNTGNSGSTTGTVNPGGPPQSSSSGSGGSASSGQGTSSTSSDSGSDDVWTGSTTVTVPTKTTPQAPEPPTPAAPPPSAHVAQPAASPVSRTEIQQVSKSTAPAMGAPTGVVPDLPRNPVELPLQQPASQPVSTPSTGGTASHDLGSANGIADVTPPGAGFRPSPGSTTDQHSAKRVSDGVPGLPSTSPD
ncbi:hypothetical protein [Kutzneria sp. CA-103260]|uniref:hypothetical protein n=1 Tax=Kutzneria sp. CA-103260 TaxID=2802641 RepID=UPI001BACC88E|nr:hypothetical protein [Kutzneria sp. CA-103260]